MFSDINLSFHLLETRTTENIHQGWEADLSFFLSLIFLKSYWSHIVLPVSISVSLENSSLLFTLNRWNAVTAIILLNVLISLFSSAYSEVGHCIWLLTSLIELENTGYR